jgi:regulator of protease activity HflC (stomatin/prohibitin superfamily)
MPSRVQEAMQMQVEAERKKRAAILESEGIKAAEINIAEGRKQSRILESGKTPEYDGLFSFDCPMTTYWVNNLNFAEAEKQELINAADGAAQAVVAAGRARAQSIEMVSESLNRPHGQNAASLAVAEKYVGAFQQLARTNNTLILPANTGDVTSMVAQAMTIYKQLAVEPGHREDVEGQQQAWI